ncbi:capsid assembly scaffolding protein Gp46 family protein [Mycobacteroides abscessus]|uniref:capsid assembly scaffolding protein Gp46 family protein n=2 Tax=Mycobacteroides abscessus TaxID=36809 RepID=UPI00069646DA|nr:DUF4355 domain-containing protein [Mycobacteroides abscessus]
MSESLMPIHPTTGLQAIGFTSRGPIWPIMGGSEDAGNDAGAGDDSGNDGADITPPAANNWWSFESKEAATEWGNKLVTDRLARDRKNKLDPLTAERDTLKAEVERLKQFEAAGQTDAQRWEAEKATLANELQQLREFKASTDRNNLAREIAEEIGLPVRFASRITGDDEDAMRADAQELLDVLSEGGSNTKKTPAQKAPKDTAPQGDGPRKGQSGGGGSSEDSDEAMTASILDQIKQDRERGGLTTRR